MKSKTLRLTPIAAGVLAATNVAYAADYTYLLDAYDMTVGTRLGEGLIVAESCVDPADTSPTCTKVKYVTALPGRSGRIEFPINVAGAFDASMNLDFNTSSGGTDLGEALAIYSADGSSLAFTFYIYLYWGQPVGPRASCLSSATGDTGGTGNSTINYSGGYTSNDFRISVMNANASCYSNDSSPLGPITLSVPQRNYNRLAVSGINDKDRLYEVKVRGLPGAGGGTACGDVNNDNDSTVVDALIVARHDIGLAVTGSCFNQ